MKMNFLLILVLTLIWAFAQTMEVNAAMLFDWDGMDKLAKNGLTVPESGKYSLWVWAKGGSSFRLKVGDNWITKENFGGNPYSWGKIGELDLKAGENYSFQIECHEKTIGRLVISMSPNFNPQRSFELMSVFSDRPGPVADERYQEKRHTYSYFHFPKYKTKAEWEARRDEIRRKILVSAGLWPMLDKNPLKATVTETLDRDGYIIEKVFIETMPGFYFPGSLYRPKNKKGPFPAVINPHGHWRTGRQADEVQARCANFALQGYIAFSYNMVGYIDNNQMDHGFWNDLAYLWSISVGGIQLWNSIRSLDFITSLPEVDIDRIACTGCSGGGSQTFLVTAVDDRIKVTAPVCMVSSHFQGGCLCENPPSLRLDTYNVEISAAAAPRPQILVSATGDWTDLTPEIEYPDIMSIYKLLGKPENLVYYYQDAGHNYNENSRYAVYKWFGKWLLNEENPENLKEIQTPQETVETLNVFDKDHPRPADALDQEGIVKSIIARSKALMDKIWPRYQVELEEFVNKMGPALGDVLNVKVPEEVNGTLMAYTGIGSIKREKYIVKRYILSHDNAGDQVPAILYTPKGGAEKKMANLIVHPEGKAALVDFENAMPSSFISEMLDKDFMVLAIDTFLTGDHHSPFGKTERERYGRYFTTFNPVDESLKVQDILTAVSYLQSRPDVAGVNLIGIGEAGLWCLLANAFAKGINKTVADVVGFNNRDDSQWVRHLNIPGILRVGGFDTAGACFAPRPLLIHNTGSEFDADRIKAIYEMLDQSEKLKVIPAKGSDQEILSWLME